MKKSLWSLLFTTLVTLTCGTLFAKEQTETDTRRADFVQGFEQLLKNTEAGLTQPAVKDTDTSSKGGNGRGAFVETFAIAEKKCRFGRWRRSGEFLKRKSYAGGGYERQGTGVEHDGVKALQWYKKAADQGLAHAQYLVGCCYEYGTGSSENNKVAAEWYRKASKQGHISARYALKALEAK